MSATHVQRFGPAVIIHGPPLLDLLCLAMLGAQVRRRRDGVEASDQTRRMLQTIADAARHVIPEEEPVPSEIIAAPMTTREAARLLGMSGRQVQRLAPRLGGHKIGGRIIVERASVAALAEARHGRMRDE